MASLTGAVVLAALLSCLTPRQGIGGIGLAMSVALVVQVGIQTVGSAESWADRSPVSWRA